MEVLLREAALGDGMEDAFDFSEFVVGVQVRRHAHRGLVVARECAEQKALSMARAFEVLDRFECAGGTGGIVGLALTGADAHDEFALSLELSDLLLKLSVEVVEQSIGTHRGARRPQRARRRGPEHRIDLLERETE